MNRFLKPHHVWFLLLAGCGEKQDDSDSTADADADGYTASVDCDDADESIHPGADEVCDGLDNDCDDLVDDDDDSVTGQTEWCPDTDGDGFGDSEESLWILSCDQPSGYLDSSESVTITHDSEEYEWGLCGLDCSETEATVHPGAEEICDGLDNDCDGEIDEGC